jgi:hypothetical protein
MNVQSKPKLLEVVRATATTGRLPGCLNGRQEQADERADDGDHHEQLDERKRVKTFRKTSSRSDKPSESVTDAKVTSTLCNRV